MKVGTEDKKKLITAGVLGFFAIFAVVFLYNELFGGPSTPPVQAPPVVIAKPTPGAKSGAGNAAVRVGSVSGQLDPTLHFGAMRATESLVYTGTGRNIFAPGPLQAPAPKIEQAKFSARPGPVIPQRALPQGPPPKPPINLKFFGTATQDGVRRALLLSGDDVFLASAGDIVQRRYKIVSITANSVVVEDVPNSNQQNLPLAAN
jgi:hypothetical protein